jgi:hypothetical protein
VLANVPVRQLGTLTDPKAGQQLPPKLAELAVPPLNCCRNGIPHRRQLGGSLATGAAPGPRGRFPLQSAVTLLRMDPLREPPPAESSPAAPLYAAHSRTLRHQSPVLREAGTPLHVPGHPGRFPLPEQPRQPRVRLPGCRPGQQRQEFQFPRQLRMQLDLPRPEHRVGERTRQCAGQ